MRRLIEHDEDEINRILSREDEILPSSGFAVSVMDAVRREAAAPPPIPFPWKRALPGLVVGGIALALVLVAGVVAIAQLGRASTTAVFHVLAVRDAAHLPRRHRVCGDLDRAGAAGGICFRETLDAPCFRQG